MLWLLYKNPQKKSFSMHIIHRTIELLFNKHTIDDRKLMVVLYLVTLLPQHNCLYIFQIV